MHQFHHVVKSFDEDQQMCEFVFHYHYPIKQTEPKQTKITSELFRNNQTLDSVPASFR
jgi:hypothetical protein